MAEFFGLLKNGNKPSLYAAITNTFIAIMKGVAFFFTGNVAMFAETMHSIGDAANQYFVFIGSALSKKAPTKQFPNGFGRLLNIVLLGAVLIVGIMAYETIVEGWHQMTQPVEAEGFIISVVVLSIAIILETFVLYKAGKEILHEAGVKGGAMAPLTTSFAHMDRAKPATKLVFMEDLVATAGGLLALIAVLIAHYTGFLAVEGAASIAIGLMMFYVVMKVFLENARGAIGETDEQMVNHIAHLLSEHPDVKDIRKLEVIKEGEFLHVETKVEVNPSLSVAEADELQDRIAEVLLSQPSVNDVVVSLDADDGVKHWTHVSKRPESMPPVTE
ncbi:cation diffusion facilitator family transporter [Planococcus shenhongbingii]|uniref:Cation diffusion facilitator family transporter n=1 Tax=Planococcus shenhongbingii TaxID=3058398 RepID=A0ABT8NH11_9BACL|nr:MULTISPECIES: cation diffusion facilitator family transporter [unclassified Planococcus (in: firmicutes)]MDN7247195.1 cation diffusion facilitator family transporter [Planococcus sp. N017]WKA59780.1 cation diffusion facilitator family transporter [Planococcus sp. N016]